MAQSKLNSEKVASHTESAQIKGSTQIFCFSLPDGLSLRSVGIVDGVPELRFTSSPRVPTLQEGDFAAAFRLASEGKRPEFFYVGFPHDHPLHSCRWFNHYCPAWLRGTTLGNLLADVDWNMKCLDVGARSDEDKTRFKSWSASSNLKGLATRLDFPQKENMLGGSIKMYCEHAKVQKSNDEIFFPEEPKMKIIDQCSVQYSKYITEHLPSVAYHDEPKFLKMQEVIKLILAVEWLYFEKNIRVNQNWIRFHTENVLEEEYCTLIETFPESKTPPKEMIPSIPTDFKPPNIDVAVSTKKSEIYEALAKNKGVKYRYGYLDFGGCEARIFTEEGEEFLFQDCLKCSVVVHSPDGTITGYHYIAIDEQLFINMFKILGSFKFPLPFEVTDDNVIPVSDTPKLPLPKESLMLQVPVTPSINMSILATLQQKMGQPSKDENSSNIKEDESLTVVGEKNIKEPSDTLDEKNVPITSSTNAEMQDFHDKKDQSTIETPEVLPSKDSETISSQFLNDAMSKLENSEKKESFGPLEAFFQSLEDTLTVDFQTLITCFKPVLDMIVKKQFPLPVTTSVSIEEFIFNEDEMKLSIDMSVSRHAPFILPHFEIKGTLKMAPEDLDYLFAHSDPNAPVHAAIPGLCEALIPGVFSWEELLSELSTPMPRFWQDPYTGIGAPTAMGGVSTQDIPIQIIPNIPSGPSLAGCAVAATTSGLASLGLLANVTPKSKPPEFEPSPELR